MRIQDVRARARKVMKRCGRAALLQATGFDILRWRLSDGLRKTTGAIANTTVLTRKDILPKDSPQRDYIAFARNGHDLVLTASEACLGEKHIWLMDRLPGLIEILARCERDVRGIAEVSDGELSDCGIVSYCGKVPGGILVPDHDFVASRGYASTRALAVRAPPFSERKDLVLWRGVTTGRGIISGHAMRVDDPQLILRTRMCLALRDIPGCDVKLSRVVASDEPEVHAARLGAAGVFDQWVSPRAWTHVRYHIAVDGFTLAWSSTFTRLLLGCCVLKPDSLEGYRQWYSDRLGAWQHYVPVAGDMSDLVARIAWCRSHPDEAAAIARRGQELALSMTYQREMMAAARHLDEAHTLGNLRVSQ